MDLIVQEVTEVEDQWDAALIKEMRGTPSQPNPSRPGSAILVKISFDDEEEKENASKEKPAVKSPPKLDREKVRTSSTGSVLECLFRTST